MDDILSIGISTGYDIPVNPIIISNFEQNG